MKIIPILGVGISGANYKIHKDMIIKVIMMSEMINLSQKLVQNEIFRCLFTLSVWFMLLVNRARGVLSQTINPSKILLEPSF